MIFYIIKKNLFYRINIHKKYHYKKALNQNKKYLSKKAVI